MTTRQRFASPAVLAVDHLCWDPEGRGETPEPSGLLASRRCREEKRGHAAVVLENAKPPRDKEN